MVQIVPKTYELSYLIYQVDSLSEAFMTPIERLNAALQRARAGAQREGSDRHSNPRRAARDLRLQAQAQFDVTRLEEAAAVALKLDTARVSWTADDQGSISFVFTDGSLHPTAKGESLNAQVQLIQSAASEHEAFRALTMRALNPRASRDFKWLRDRLVGSSAPKFRSVFLTRAGLLNEGTLTEFGRSTGFFEERDGEYGLYQIATATGVGWIYAAYLAGNVPLTIAARKLSPQRNVELDIILEAVGLPADLDSRLQALTDS